MGVDFYACPICDETFPDCGEYTRCGNCYTSFCGEDCAELEPVEGSEDEKCCICRLAVILDLDLLAFALRKLGCTRAQLEQELRDELKKGQA